MQSILLDTYSLHSLTTSQSCMVKSVTGLGFPEVQLDVYPRAGIHGVTVAHNLYRGRLITIEGTIRGISASTYLANRQSLQQAVGLRLDSNNVPIVRTLFLTDLNFGTYQVSVVTKSFVCDLKDPTFNKWQLQLQAADYILESQTTTSTSLSLPVSGGVTFPITFPITFGSASGGTSTITNSGTEAAFPTIVINGPCINPVISNDSTGEFISLNTTLVAGDVLTINCKARTILQGTTSTTNKMSAKRTGSTFFSIPSGANSLRFAADAYDTGTATVTLRSAYLGI